MHRTQLLRICDKVENVDRALAAVASQDRQNLYQERDATLVGDGGGKASTTRLSLRKYWLLKNMNSLDGLPGLLTAPDVILGMPPQSSFDKDSPRPMLRRNTEIANTARDRKWFTSGFVLGAVTVFAITRLAGGLRG